MQIKKSLLSKLLLLFLIKPVGVVFAFQLTSVFRYISLIYVIIVGGLLLLERFRSGKQSIIYKNSPHIYIFCFFFFLMLSTILNGEELKSFFYFVANNLALILWFQINYKIDKEGTLRFLSYYFTIITLINDFFVLVSPGGIAEIVSSNGFTHIYHVWGIDNTFAIYLIPGLCISLYYFVKYERRTWKAEVLLVVIYLFGAIKLQTMSTSVGLTLISLFVLIKNIRGVTNIKLKYGAFALILLITYLINFRGLTLFPKLIENVLHKSVTFSGRTILWSQAIEMITSSPLLGYGFQSSEELFAFNQYSGLYSSHSLYLQLLIYGGFVSALFLFLLLFSTIRLVDKSFYSRYEYLMAGIYGLLIYFIFEFNANISSLFLMIEILYCETKRDSEEMMDYFEK